MSRATLDKDCLKNSIIIQPQLIFTDPKKIFHPDYVLSSYQSDVILNKL